MLKWAIYRIHYGVDFLEASIESVKDSVDKVFVFYSKYPWVRKPTVNYLGEEIEMLDVPEDVEDFMQKVYGNDPKVAFFQYECKTPKDQFRNLLQEAVEIDDIAPERVLFMEPDMVFYKPDLERLFEKLLERRDLPCLGPEQVELWKTIDWRVPYRERTGPMLWALDRVSDFNTDFGTYTHSAQFVVNTIPCYNFGFCLNDQTMLYKHLSAINFSQEIGDSIPSQEWYEEKWLNWTPETTDLEIAEKWKHLIPKAERFDMPKEAKQQFLPIIWNENSKLHDLRSTL